MAKNNRIDDALASILEPEEKNEQTTTKGRPRAKDTETKTYRVNSNLAAKLRYISSKEGIMQKDLLDYAIGNVVARYEEKHGVIDTSENLATKKLDELF